MFPFLLLLFAASPSTDTLRLSEAIRLAREASPMLRAEHLRAMAATERVSQAAAFPDPEHQNRSGSGAACGIVMAGS